MKRIDKIQELRDTQKVLHYIYNSIDDKYGSYMDQAYRKMTLERYNNINQVLEDEIQTETMLYLSEIKDDIINDISIEMKDKVNNKVKQIFNDIDKTIFK